MDNQILTKIHAFEGIENILGSISEARTYFIEQSKWDHEPYQIYWDSWVSDLDTIYDKIKQISIDIDHQIRPV